MSTALDSYSVTPVGTIEGPGSAELTGAATLPMVVAAGTIDDSDLMPNRPVEWPEILDWPGSGTVPVPHEYALISGSPSSVADATGPKSPGQVLRFVNLGDADPGEGQQTPSGYLALQSLDLTQVYIARWLRPSANYVGDPVGGKSLMVHFSAGNSVYFNYETPAEGMLITPSCDLPIGGGNDARNQTILPRINDDDPLVRDEWGLWEFLVQLNTPGESDGAIKVWAHGQPQINVTDYKFRLAGATWTIENISCNFYQNDTQEFDRWWDMDHFYVSGQ